MITGLLLGAHPSNGGPTIYDLCDYSYPTATQTLDITGGISTTSNYMFLLTWSQYRDENVSTSHYLFGTRTIISVGYLKESN